MKKEVEINDPKYDTTFKILFKDHTRMKSFLNAVYGFKGNQEIADIEILDTEMGDYGNFTEDNIRGPGKTLIFDIKCRDRAGQYFIIEMQRLATKDFLNRVIVYGARQLVNADHELFQTRKKEYENNKKKYGVDKAYRIRNKLPEYYNSIPPVRVLAILDYEGFPDTKDYFTQYEISRKGQPLQTRPLLSWDFIELPKFVSQFQDYCHTPIERWLYLLSRSDDEKIDLSLENITGNDKIIIDAYKRLSNLTKKEREELDQYKEDLRTTSSFIATWHEEGKIGKAKEIAKNMLSKGFGIDTISELTGLSEKVIDNISIGEALPEDYSHVKQLFEKEKYTKKRSDSKQIKL